MQTFLPYADFKQSARVLDLKRLGKQRVEVVQIVRALTVPNYAWANHPAVLMWKGYEEALGRYGLTMCQAWTSAGFDDTCSVTISDDLAKVDIAHIRSEQELSDAGELPSWVHDESVQRSHQSALVRKFPEHYRQYFPDVPDDIEYFWPVRSPKVVEAELRKAENVKEREERAVARAMAEAEKQRRRRSLAAKRAWKARKAGQSKLEP